MRSRVPFFNGLIKSNRGEKNGIETNRNQQVGTDTVEYKSVIHMIKELLSC